jgi:hypothetical protein
LNKFNGRRSEFAPGLTWGKTRLKLKAGVWDEYVSLTPEQLADVEQCVLNGLGFYEEAKRIRLAEAKSC